MQNEHPTYCGWLLGRGTPHGVAGVGSPHGLLTERLHFHKDAGHCRFDALSLGGRTVSTPGWQFASLSWFVLTSARSNH